MNLHLDFLSYLMIFNTAILVIIYTIRYIVLLRARVGKIPDRLKRFPEFKACLSNHLVLKADYNSLIDSALTGNQVVIQMSTNDINEMFHAGKQVIKCIPTRHRFYEISNDYIHEYNLQWPEMGKDLCYCFHREISYYMAEHVWLENSRYTPIKNDFFTSSGWKEKNDGYVDEQIVILRDSSFLLKSLGFADSLSLLQLQYPSDYERFTTFISKIKHIEIDSTHLKITT